jgi:serine/threonine protein kinase
MSGMLAMDPKDRYTALDCLSDPFFDGLREPEIEKLVQ